MQVFTGNDMLERAVTSAPGRVAVKDQATELTWKQFHGRAQHAAAYLLTAGVVKGDRVAIFMENGTAQLSAMMGVLRAGGVFININPRLKPRQIQHIIADSGARVMIVQPELRQALAAVDARIIESEQLFFDGVTVAASLPHVIDRDLACLIYTSGSTGKPKGVIFRHADIVMCARVMAEALGHRADDRTLCTLPFSADYGLTLWYMTLLTSSTLVMRNSFLAHDIAQTLQREHITSYSGITPIWPILYGSRSDFPQQSFPDLRYVTIGGGYPPRRVMEAILKQFRDKADIYLLYGLTEASWSTYVPPNMLEKKLGSIGVALPNVEVLLLDDEGSPVPVGQEGELVHRGGVVAAGYWQNREKTKQVFRELDGERVVYSGDLVTRDQDGYFYFKSRKDTQIKVQGFRVATQDILDCIFETGLVDEACVFSVPDEAIEQRCIACVKPKAGLKNVKDQIIRHLEKELPSYMVPRELYILERLPYTQSHKIDIVQLRELYEANKLESKEFVP